MSIHSLSAGAGQFAASICDSTLHEDTSVGRQNNLQNQVSIVTRNQTERWSLVERAVVVIWC